MNINASPRPDDFGPGFYRKFRGFLKPKILRLFQQFYTQSLDTSSINTTYLILHPKNNCARTPAQFRPISLQNCPIKAIAKLLVNRLQKFIPQLIHGDQTGFVSSRSIFENFTYVAKLLNSCHKRKAHIMVIKLDFMKAFDSVSWDSLQSVLQERGSPPPLFCSWIHNIRHTGKTTIILNGVPGCWIQCKNGLRQGDPISPYLYIIFSNTLRQLIRTAFEEGTIMHPIIDGIQTTVLQYADDTLIISKASLSAASHLKHTLDKFASATRLQINFDKTTFLPLHVPEELANSIVAELGYPIQTFPQTNLGLPLSPTKLPPSAYEALLDRIDYCLID
jgi:hypothetical protein